MELTRRAFTKAAAFLSISQDAEELSLADVMEQREQRAETVPRDGMGADELRSILEEIVWAIQNDKLGSAHSTTTQELASAIAMAEWGDEDEQVVRCHMFTEAYDDYGRISIDEYPTQEAPAVGLGLNSGVWGSAGCSLPPEQAKELATQLTEAAEAVDQRHQEWLDRRDDGQQ